MTGSLGGRLPLVALLLLAAPAAAQLPGPQPRLGARHESATGSPANEGGADGGRKRLESEDKDRAEPEDRESEEVLPSPLAPLLEHLNPGRYHRILDQMFGLDDGDVSPRPRAPEIPLAVFVEVIRPLGALKYESQFNYFQGNFCGTTPTLKQVTAEYLFADWNAVRFEASWRDDRLEAFAVGYQRTLGVGPNHNWAHGVVVLPEFFVHDAFTGGLAFYTFGWKPTERSPVSVGLSAGIDRALFTGAEAGMTRVRLENADDRDRQGRREGEPEPRAAVWRPLLSANAWYSFSKRWTIGVENDAFIHERFGEYLVLPHVIWRPTERFFVQAGAGYYRVAGQDQATVMVRVNVLNPSPREPLDSRQRMDEIRKQLGDERNRRQEDPERAGEKKPAGE